MPTTVSSHILPAKLTLYCFYCFLTAVEQKSHRLLCHEMKYRVCALIAVWW